jgi:hypothetical protein
MKRAVRLTIFGLVMYGIFVTVAVPASWIYRHGLQARLGGVALYGIQGTIWKGRAATLISKGVRLEDLHWDLHPWTLLWGRAESALSFNYQAAPGKMVIARSLNGAWIMKDIAVELPARQLVPLLHLPGADLGGKLMLQLSSLAVKHGRVTAAEGNLSWENAALRKPVLVELGTFVIKVGSNAEGVSGTLIDQGGPIQAQGLFKLQANGQYQLTATFASRDPRQTLITQGLSLFGASGTDGRVHYSASGIVPAILPGTG